MLTPLSVVTICHHITKIMFFFFYMFTILEKGLTLCSESKTLEVWSQLVTPVVWAQPKGGSEWMSAIDEPEAGPWRQAKVSLEAECPRSKAG